MSFVDLPQVRAQNTGEDIEEYARHLANLLSMYRDTLDFVINGHINFKNIQALGITTKNLEAGSVVADKIDVTELSAIAANLGIITAGIINAVTINGATINIDDDVTIGNNLNLGASSYTGSKRITWSSDLGISAYLQVMSGDMSINTNGFITLTIGSSQGLVVNQVVDAAAIKSNTITNQSNVPVIFSGDPTDSHVEGNHDHGIPNGTQLLDADGVTVWTFNTDGGFTHSHTVL